MSPSPLLPGECHLDSGNEEVAQLDGFAGAFLWCGYFFTIWGIFTSLLGLWQKLVHLTNGLAIGNI